MEAVKKKQPGHRAFLLNVLGGVGYFTVFMEWFWLLALYLPGFFESEVGRTIFPEAKPQPTALEPVTSAPVEPSAFMTFLFVLVALAVIALVLYVVFAKYIPTAARATTKVVHVATEKAVPVVAHKPLEKIPTRKRKVLTERVMFWVKLSAAVLPLLFVFASRFQDLSVESQLLILGFAMLCAFSTSAFIIERFLAHRWNRKTT